MTEDRTAELAILRYTVVIETKAAVTARHYRGQVEFADLHAQAMLLIAGYATGGKLARWEELNKPDSYVGVVLRNDLMDYAEQEVRAWRRSHGLPPGRHSGKGRLTDEDKKTITELHRQGLGSRAIARVIGRERDTVRYWTRKLHNVEPS